MAGDTTSCTSADSPPETTVRILHLEDSQADAELIQEMLTDLAARHSRPKAFLRAYARTMADWMQESGFQSGCPIATTLLETAPRSPSITQAGQRAIDGWIEVIAGVLVKGGMAPGRARSRAQLIIATMEGALILARVRQSTRPILDVASLVEGP